MGFQLLSYRMKWMVVVGFLVTLAVPASVFAWGMLGHRVTGGIAEHYLNAKARAEIRKLLGNESLAMAGNWADFIKSDRSYDYLGLWHYVNIKAGLSRQEVMKMLKEDTGVDLYTRLNFLIKELKSKNLARDKQVFYLKLLIHLIADAHQPMHKLQYSYNYNQVNTMNQQLLKGGVRLAGVLNDIFGN